MEVREGLYMKEFHTKLFSLTLNESNPQAVKLRSQIYAKMSKEPLDIICNMRKQDKGNEILNKFPFHFIKNRISYF